MRPDYKFFGRVGVLMGGYSSEREISLKSGGAILKALEQEGCSVCALDIQDREEEKISAFIESRNIDIAFIALHGVLGEDGQIQSTLERLGIAYTGSGPQANKTALDKNSTQNLLKNNGIPVPSYVSLTRNDDGGSIDFQKLLGPPPYVVKPATEGSSIGITLVNEIGALAAAYQVARGYGDCLLVEKFIKGRELTVGILGEEALPVVEICPRSEFFDFLAKYQSGMTEYVVPAKIPSDVAGQIRKAALDVHRLIGCRDLSRVDFMLDESNRFFVLEINTIPGFTATSLLPKAAREAGLNFNQVCLKLVEMANGRKKENKNKTGIS